MAAAVSVSPASPRSTIDACVISVTGADQNDTGAPVPADYPVQAEKRYYLTFESPDGTEQGRSYVFGVNEDGDHDFQSYIFPSAGTYVVHLRDTVDDSSVADSGNVTVS